MEGNTGDMDAEVSDCGVEREGGWVGALQIGGCSHVASQVTQLVVTAAGAPAMPHTRP